MSEPWSTINALQKTQRVRVADFCRERMLDYHEMVEALKKDKFLSEMPQEQAKKQYKKDGLSPETILANRKTDSFMPHLWHKAH